MKNRDIQKSKWVLQIIENEYWDEIVQLYLEQKRKDIMDTDPDKMIEREAIYHIYKGSIQFLDYLKGVSEDHFLEENRDIKET